MNAHINVDKNICDLKCYEPSYHLKDLYHLKVYLTKRLQHVRTL